jgi:hypothetical protein
VAATVGAGPSTATTDTTIAAISPIGGGVS